MNQSLQTIPADFFGTDVSIIDHNGQRWLTAEDIGLCLGYSSDKARQSINNLFNRHADDFTEADSTVIKLMTVDGKLRDVRVFSQSGCVTIAWAANTPKAKQFRIWAKQILVGHLESQADSHALSDRLESTLERMANSIDLLAQGMNATLLQHNTTAKYIGLLEMNQRGHVRITREIEKQVLELYAGGMPQPSIANLLRISKASVNLLVKGKYKFSPLAGTPCTPAEISAAVIDRMITEERERTLRFAASLKTAQAA